MIVPPKWNPLHPPKVKIPQKPRNKIVKEFSKSAGITDRLDEVAGALEASGGMVLALAVDMVSDRLAAGTMKDFMDRVMNKLKLNKLPDPDEAAQKLSILPRHNLDELYGSLTDDIYAFMEPSGKTGYDVKLLGDLFSVANSAAKRLKKDIRGLSKEDIRNEINFLLRA